MSHSKGEFSVCQFFPDDNYEYVKRFVGAEEAIATAINLTQSVGGRIGTTARVIVTDGGDCVAWEWEYGKGQTFPPTTRVDEGATP